MLETVLIAVLTAVATSLLVNFAMHWTERIRLRRLETEIELVAETTMREQRRRAAAASVAARRSPQLTPEDARLAAAGLQQLIPEEGEDPWWSRFAREKDKVA